MKNNNPKEIIKTSVDSPSLNGSKKSQQNTSTVSKESQYSTEQSQYSYSYLVESLKSHSSHRMVRKLSKMGII